MSRTRVIDCPWCFQPVEVDKDDVLDGRSSRHNCWVMENVLSKLPAAPAPPQEDTDE